MAIKPKKTKQEVTNSAAAQEAALRTLQQKDGKKNVQRVTIDFPIAVHNRMVAQAKEEGRTKKSFIIRAIERYLDQLDS